MQAAFVSDSWRLLNTPLKNFMKVFKCSCSVSCHQYVLLPWVSIERTLCGAAGEVGDIWRKHLKFSNLLYFLGGIQWLLLTNYCPVCVIKTLFSSLLHFGCEKAVGHTLVSVQIFLLAIHENLLYPSSLVR